MKKILTLCALLAIGSTGFAETMTCNIRPVRATSSGLMPDDDSKLIKVTANIVEFSKTNNVDVLKQCADSSLNGLKIQLCAQESDFVGGYAVTIAAFDNGDEVFPSTSAYLLGVKRTGKTGLTFINGAEGVMDTMLEKMLKAKINMPEKLEGDSLAMDEAISAGVKQNIIKEGDLVLLGLDIATDSCVVNK